MTLEKEKERSMITAVYPCCVAWNRNAARHTFVLPAEKGGAKSIATLLQEGEYSYTGIITTDEALNRLDDALEVHLVCFGRTMMNDDDVVAGLCQLGLHPITLVGLLRLGKAYPTAQLQGPIVALDRCYRSKYGTIPYLCGDKNVGTRNVSKNIFPGAWYHDYRFAGIPF